MTRGLDRADVDLLSSVINLLTGKGDTLVPPASETVRLTRDCCSPDWDSAELSDCLDRRRNTLKSPRVDK